MNKGNCVPEDTGGVVKANGFVELEFPLYEIPSTPRDLGPALISGMSD